MSLDPEKFALAVVSGNSVPGDTPQEIAEHSLTLYLEALAIAKQEKKESSKDWKF